MPSVSKKQQQFFGAELSRARRGEKTKTGMSVEKIEHFSRTPTKGLPVRKPKKGY